MPAPLATVALALVETGWAGYVAITVGAVVAVARPRERTSVAELWREVVRAAAKAHGNPTAWRSYVNSAGYVVIEGPSAFTLSLAGVARTRSGFASLTYSGASTYTADTAFTVGYAFAGADLVGLDGGGLNEGRPHGTGSVAGDGILDTAVQHPLERWGEGELRIDGPLNDGVLADFLDLEDERAWDIWFQGCVMARARIGGARLERLALGGASTRVSLVLRLAEVR